METIRYSPLSNNEQKRDVRRTGHGFTDSALVILARKVAVPVGGAAE